MLVLNTTEMFLFISLYSIWRNSFFFFFFSPSKNAMYSLTEKKSVENYRAETKEKPHSCLKILHARWKYLSSHLPIIDKPISII